MDFGNRNPGCCPGLAWARFLKEYEDAKQGYLICLVPEALQLSAQIVALPWQVLMSLFAEKS